MAATVVDVERERSELLHRAGRAGSVAELFEAVSERLRRLVAFDSAAWLATDPATCLPVAPTRVENMARFGGQEECLRLWELEFLFEDLNLYVDLARARLPAAGLWASTSGHPSRSPRFRELLRPCGYGDELRAVLRADGAPWAAVALYRDEGAPGFDRRDVELVASLSWPLARMVRDQARPEEHAAVALRGPGLLLFAPDGELLAINDEGRAWLEELPGEMEHDVWSGIRLPIVVVSTLMQARAIAEDRDDRTARVRMRSASGSWLTCHATCLHGPDGAAGETALVIERATVADIAPLATAAYGLSPRERQVTRLVARGEDTAGIAAALHLSQHTVRDHLKSIFEKVGVGTRGELVARLFAEHYAPVHFAPGQMVAAGAG